MAGPHLGSRMYVNDNLALVSSKMRQRCPAPSPNPPRGDPKQTAEVIELGREAQMLSRNPRLDGLVISTPLECANGASRASDVASMSRPQVGETRSADVSLICILERQDPVRFGPVRR